VYGLGEFGLSHRLRQPVGEAAWPGPLRAIAAGPAAVPEELGAAVGGVVPVLGEPALDEQVGDPVDALPRDAQGAG
jgi:hypothetical protein